MKAQASQLTSIGDLSGCTKSPRRLSSFNVGLTSITRLLRCQSWVLKVSRLKILVAWINSRDSCLQVDMNLTFISWTTTTFASWSLHSWTSETPSNKTSTAKSPTRSNLQTVFGTCLWTFKLTALRLMPRNWLKHKYMVGDPLSASKSTLKHSIAVLRRNSRGSLIARSLTTHRRTSICLTSTSTRKLCSFIFKLRAIRTHKWPWYFAIVILTRKSKMT